MHKRAGRWSLRVALSVSFTLAVLGCGSDKEETNNNDEGADQTLGETAIVVVVNPVQNEGHTADLPAVYGDDREGIVIDSEPGDSATTNDTGLGVLDEVPEGDLSLNFTGGSSLPFNVLQAGDVYDLAVGYDGTQVEAFPNFPIRYAVGGTILEFGTDADPALLGEALDTDDSIVYLRDAFVGDLNITGENVIFFGEGFAERDVVIDGNVLVSGGGVRIRGFTITGDIIVNGNNFGMAYSVVRGTTEIKGNAVAFLRNTFCGNVTVPSSSASLLDNRGLEPLLEVTPEECP